jgi:hypothetical protein
MRYYISIGGTSPSPTNHKPEAMKTTALNLNTATQRKLETLVASGYIARRFGAVWGMTQNEYWTLTARGEALYHII